MRGRLISWFHCSLVVHVRSLLCSSVADIGVIMSAEEFVQNPSEQLLDAWTRDQLFKVAEHIEIEVPRQGLKGRILGLVKESLVH